MALGYVSGARLTTDDTTDHIKDLSNGIDWLEPDQGGVALLKRLGMNDLTFHNTQFFWHETELAPRKMVATVADAVTTGITVPDANHVALDTLFRWDNEIVRVTAKPNATTLTVTRGFNGTTPVAHAGTAMIRIGTARPENSDALDGVTDNAVELFNYQQLFERNVEMSNDEYDQMSTGENPLTGNLKRRYIEIIQELASAVMYGVKGATVVSGKTIWSMGGIRQFLQTNVSNAAGAGVSVALIDNVLKQITDAGGNPKIMAVSTTQAIKLSALDANKIMIGKKEHVGGNPVTTTWQSVVLKQPLDLLVDNTLKDDEIYFLDDSTIKVGAKQGRKGKRSFKQEDVTPVGRDGVKFAVRGKYSLKVETEKANGLLYGLAVA